MKRFNSLLLLFVLCFFQFSNAQNLQAPQKSISKKKLAYITLMNGEEITAYIVGAKLKKGLFTALKLKKENGEKMKIEASEIHHMYAPPTGIEKLANKLDFATDIEKWGNPEMKEDYLNQGYGYFEQSKVQIKKKTKVFLLQLLNPTFCRKVKVYNDPFAKKTAGIGVAGVGVGNNEKSFYVKKSGEEVAHLIEKKKYKKEFEDLWSSCGTVSSKFPKAKWKEFTDHIVTFTDCE